VAHPRNEPWLPIFEKFPIDVLMKKLDYSRNWLDQLRSGRKTPSPKFRRQAVRILKFSEDELFGNGRKERTSNARAHTDGRTANRHRR
jgi:transcriptional regulator with XRE-family HTH domain